LGGGVRPNQEKKAQQTNPRHSAQPPQKKKGAKPATHAISKGGQGGYGGNPRGKGHYKRKAGG